MAQNIKSDGKAPSMAEVLLDPRSRKAQNQYLNQVDKMIDWRPIRRCTPAGVPLAYPGCRGTKCRRPREAGGVSHRSDPDRGGTIQTTSYSDRPLAGSRGGGTRCIPGVVGAAPLRHPGYAKRTSPRCLLV